MDKKLYVDLSNEDQHLMYAAYHDTAAIIRGHVLNAVTQLEMIIDLYITHYFTNGDTKSEELMNLVISPRMSFENKVQTLMVLIEKHNKKLIEDNCTLSNDLLHIIQERNILAHYPLDLTPWGLQKYFESREITLFKFKNVKESENGSKKEIKLTNSVFYDTNKMTTLIDLVSKYQFQIGVHITAPPPAN